MTRAAGRVFRQGLLGVAMTSAIGIFTCVLGGWLADQYGPYRMFFLFTCSRS
jgi:MFS transporter, MHS family, proline/betaine transporter